MASGIEDLRILKDAEQVSDEVWEVMRAWDRLAKEIVGVQLARAADSVGANIAEAFGRYHYSDKIRFLYYARGSLFETRFWLDRPTSRNLLPPQATRAYQARLTNLGRRLNALIRTLKSQATTWKPKPPIANRRWRLQ
ncbi:MAG TPA: four helix bundle protein [Anaerolineales bacterium]|nr:four helix bundle protein [Anaerolineales bacterium]